MMKIIINKNLCITLQRKKIIDIRSGKNIELECEVVNNEIIYTINSKNKCSDR